MEYEERTVLVALFEPIFLPLRSHIQRFPDEAIEINLTEIFNLRREAVSPAEERNREQLE